VPPGCSLEAPRRSLMGVPAGTRKKPQPQIARDLVNLRGREAVLIVLLAATGKNREKEANSQQGEQQCETG